MEKKGKIMTFFKNKIGKHRDINSILMDKDSLPIPHQLSQYLHHQQCYKYTHVNASILNSEVILLLYHWDNIISLLNDIL